MTYLVEPPDMRCAMRDVGIDRRHVRVAVALSTATAISMLVGLANVPTATALSSASASTATRTVVQVTANAKRSQKVVFACTGNAPGVTISFGDDSSNHAAARSPFSATLPLDVHAMYYDIDAQLGGSGSINCSVTVYWNQGGRNHVVRKTGSASGGYNIADPEVCGNFTGGWEAC